MSTGNLRDIFIDRWTTMRDRFSEGEYFGLLHRSDNLVGDMQSVTEMLDFFVNRTKFLEAQIQEELDRQSWDGQEE